MTGMRPTTDMIPDEAWKLRAPCRGADPELFFPTAKTGPRSAEYRRAVRDVRMTYCDRCPVIMQCRAYADHHDEKFGIWGGIGELERKKLRRLRKASL